MSDKKIYLFQDRPETSGELKFAHNVLAGWVEKLVKDLQPPYRLALTGKLGAGKSTVIHNALDSLEKNENFVVAYVDVWKLDQASARRSTIIRVAKEFGIDLTKFAQLRKSIYGTTNEINDVRDLGGLSSKISFFKQPTFWLILILSLCVGFIVYTLLNSIDATSTSWGDGQKILAGLAVSIYLTVTNIISQKVLQIKSSVSQAPYVGPEEFEEAFQMILEDSKLANKKAVVVFDNIDRAPKSKTEEILTGISTFFDHSSHKTLRNLIILVPFSSTANPELDEKTIQKFFDAIVPMPNLMPEDLLQFSREKLLAIEWSKEADEIAQLIDQSDLETPRSILHFINDIVAQVSLAEQLENKSFTSDAGEITPYLSNGSITTNKVFYSKLRLCERFKSDFLINAANDFVAPSEIFNSEKYKDSENEQDQKLFQFLRATDGIPEKAPETLEQFIYFKGSDLELSIPGSAKVIDSLNKKSLEDLKSFVDKDTDLVLLEKLFKFNISKNRKNPLRLKNTVMSVLEVLPDEIPSTELRRELSRAIVKYRKIIEDLSFDQINLIAPDGEEGIENIAVWYAVDERYKELKKEQSGTTPELEKWKREYLKNVLSQSSGLKRVKLDDSDFKSEYFKDHELFKLLDENGLEDFVGDINKQPILEYAKSAGFVFDNQASENLGKAIAMAVSKMNVEQASFLRDYFGQMWSVMAGQISDYPKLTSLMTSFLHQLKEVKKTEFCNDQCWTQFHNLNNQSGHLNNLIVTSEKQLVAFLLMLNDRITISGHNHLMNYVRGFVNKASAADFFELRNIYGNWTWFSQLETLVPNELKAKFSDPIFVEGLAIKAQGAAASYLRKNIETILLSDAFEKVFDGVETESKYTIQKKDFAKEILANQGKYDFKKTKKVFEFFNANEEQVKALELDKMVNGQLIHANSKEEVEYLIDWSKKNKISVLATVNVFKDEIEDESARSWDQNDSFKFFALVSASTERPDDFYNVLFDKAIERGVFSGQDASVVKTVSETLFDSWRNKRGLTKKSLEHIKRGIDENSHLPPEEKSVLMKSIEQLAKSKGWSKDLGFELSIKNKIKAVLGKDN